MAGPKLHSPVTVVGKKTLNKILASMENASEKGLYYEKLLLSGDKTNWKRMYLGIKENE